ncbi:MULTISPECIES: hypothetical protein [unclassified Ruminococcus]|uniref:hypothetical protein n=1 Tax=unclassified Ruminococcus TaxID=2608920 RepID=UPI00210B467F|nr:MULTISPECIES: hypothetical protein [unclassified Ruminococcus]MCQ4022228.1 hypothetical protein [Ruminococcus sp. zg-924]MCQ4115209.1 hypothetical protein [Ruminococcus sp. zg-921]
MDCNLIFYSARRTGYCETALKASLSVEKYRIARVLSAFNPEMLGDKINESLSECNVIFIIGGISRDDELSTPDLLSKAFSKNTPLPKSEKLTLNGKVSGYKLSCLKQTIYLLPDEPDEIAQLAAVIVK